MNIQTGQVGKPVIKDPDSVGEKFANGPVNITGVNDMVTLTFTTLRPNVSKLFTGDVEPLEGVVTARVTMPFRLAMELRELLNANLPRHANAANGPQRKQ